MEQYQQEIIPSVLKCCFYGSVYSAGWTALKMLDICHLKHHFTERNTKKFYRFQEGKKRRHTNTGKLIAMNAAPYFKNIFYRLVEIKSVLSFNSPEKEFFSFFCIHWNTKTKHSKRVSKCKGPCNLSIKTVLLLCVIICFHLIFCTSCAFPHVPRTILIEAKCQGPHESSLSSLCMSFTDNPEEGRVAQLTATCLLKLI